MTQPMPLRPTLLRAAAALACAAATAALLSCSGGTPAAPEGAIIIVDFAYVEGTRNETSGDFQARIMVRVLDEESNVPETGVGVFFQVKSGPGRFLNASPVVTNNQGYAENVLDARGATATPSNPVTVYAFSGLAQSSDLALTVSGGITTDRDPPVAFLTVNPSNPGTGDTVTADVSASTAAACPGDDPTEWDVDWDDGTDPETYPFSDPNATHQYATAGTYTVSVTVRDCFDQEATATRSITVSP